MAVFKFGGGTTTVGGPGQVTEDHIFVSETERDAYFVPDRLTELVTSTPILVTISGSPVLQTWNAATPADEAAYSAANWITADTATLSLEDNEVPVKMAGANVLVGSGFLINPVTRALQGERNIETLADIQSGVSTFRLGQAHTITSAGENVTFRNSINNVAFHPTWQTTESTGDWNSVQRTPVGDLIQDFVFQSDRSETVTNPNFMFTSLPVDHRLYEIQVEPIQATENVIVVIQQRNPDGVFVDYWRSRLINLTTSQLASPTPQNIAINPFIDLRASTEYRLIAGALTDIQLRGNAAGVPRILLTYRQWEDLPLALQRDTTTDRNRQRLVLGDRRINNNSFLRVGDVRGISNGSGVMFDEDITLCRINWDRQPHFRAGFLRVYINGVSTLDLPIEATQSGEYTIPNPQPIPARTRITIQWRSTQGSLTDFIITFLFK